MVFKNMVLMGLCANLAVVGVLYSSSSKTESVSDPNGSEFKKIVIPDASGKAAGVLQESKAGDILYWIETGEKPVEICSCSEEVRNRVQSPDKSKVIAVYVRNCGATTDWATRVDLLGSNEKPGEDDRRTLFVMKGMQSLDITWENNTALVIVYPHSAKQPVYRQLPKIGNVAITYRSTTWPANQSKYTEFSNFNYGLTGMSAGIHKQIIMRMAGWAQKRTGMTKDEWGRWYGSSPFGDDPNEMHYIEQGILWYNQNRDKINQKRNP